MTSRWLDWRAAPGPPQKRDNLSNLRGGGLALNFRTASDLGRRSAWSECPVSQARKLKVKGGPRRVIQPVRSMGRSGPGG